jgi:hypothetical protein
MAHFGFRIPDPLSFEGNVAENWRRFKQEYDILVEATYSANSKKSKAAMLDQTRSSGPDPSPTWMVKQRMTQLS